jgi:hypothetical protein
MGCPTSSDVGTNPDRVPSTCRAHEKVNQARTTIRIARILIDRSHVQRTWGTPRATYPSILRSKNVGHPGIGTTVSTHGVPHVFRRGNEPRPGAQHMSRPRESESSPHDHSDCAHSIDRSHVQRTWDTPRATYPSILRSKNAGHPGIGTTVSTHGVPHVFRRGNKTRAGAQHISRPRKSESSPHDHSDCAHPNRSIPRSKNVGHPACYLSIDPAFKEREAPRNRDNR